MAQYLLSVHSVEGQIDTPMTDEEMQESWKQIQALGLRRRPARTRHRHRRAHV